MGESAVTSGLMLTVENFRGLRRAFWAPEGVCALVGPNASGKSTLMGAFKFVRDVAMRTAKDAIQMSGGMLAFATHDPVLDTPGDDPALARVRFTVDAPEARWTLAFPVATDMADVTYDESLVVHGPKPEQPPANVTWSHTEGTSFWAMTRLGTLRDTLPGLVAMDSYAVHLRQRLNDLSFYRPWELQHLRARPFSDPTLDDVVLAPDGANLFVVLQNWRDARKDAWRYEWVIENMRRIHAHRVSGLELKKGGGVLGAQFYAPGDEVPLPVGAMSDGILSTLLSLTAAAGGRDGGLVFIDEPENGLHPSAIRALVDAFRELHEKQNVHVVLATHSPTILNAFGETPEDVWVTEQKVGAAFPARLTELRDPEWLANFRLGNIYGTAFGRQDPFSGSGG